MVEPNSWHPLCLSKSRCQDDVTPVPRCADTLSHRGFYFKWSEQQDSNLRPSRPERDALPGCAMLRGYRHLRPPILPADERVSNRIQDSLQITKFFNRSQSRPVSLEKVVNVFLPLIRLGKSDTHSRLCDRRVLTLSFVLLLRMYFINLAFGVGIPIGMHIRGGPEHASATRPFVNNYNPAALGCELMSIHPHIVKA